MGKHSQGTMAVVQTLHGPLPAASQTVVSNDVFYAFYRYPE